MGKVNVWLKRSYIFVTSLMAIGSALLLAATLFSHGHFYDEEELSTEPVLTGLHVMYSISIITLVLAITGVYGACKERKWALILFAVGMILSSLFMIAGEIKGLVTRPKEAENFKKEFLNTAPLKNANESISERIDAIQAQLQCCGLDQGYIDWGFYIPESCLCTEELPHLCVEAPTNSSLFGHRTDNLPTMIYIEPCLPHLIVNEMGINAVLSVMLGITLFWILSVVLSVVILCQLKQKKEDTPIVVYSPEAKAGNYTVLADAADYT